jgi:hypothetical protein
MTAGQPVPVRAGYFTTENDQHAAIGRLVERFSKAKAQRAALLAEAQRLTKALEDTATSLKQIHMVEDFWDGRQDAHIGRRTKWFTLNERLPDRATLLFLLDELRTISTEIRECRKLLAEAGVALE